MVVQISQRDHFLLQQLSSRKGLVLHLGEKRTALAMADCDGELAAFHAVEEDGGRGRIVEDFDHAEAGFEGVAFVALEDGPACCVGDEACVGELSEELAAVADADGECVGAGEEGGELLTEVGV